MTCITMNGVVLCTPKCGIYGTYTGVEQLHLPRYRVEQVFRLNTLGNRMNGTRSAAGETGVASAPVSRRTPG
jgi:hypothetical protein